jgi:hypothetical protein
VSFTPSAASWHAAWAVAAPEPTSQVSAHTAASAGNIASITSRAPAATTCAERLILRVYSAAAAARLPGVRSSAMPKYVIERDIPGAGKLTAAELTGISQKSCSVLAGMGPQIQWVHSYVTADKIYCVYIAPNEELVREHARQGGFPANRVSEVATMIDPTTSES